MRFLTKNKENDFIIVLFFFLNKLFLFLCVQFIDESFIYTNHSYNFI